MRRRIAIGIGTLGLMTGGCDAAFYFPLKAPTTVASGARDIALRAGDGTRLHGWQFEPDGQPIGTVVQFHGNAGNVTTHFDGLRWVTEHGYRFITFDYRGYGQSEGIPTREGVRLDAIAALEYADGLPQADEPDLVLVGQSLGGAVLLGALGRWSKRSRLLAVVIEGSFDSYEGVASDIMMRHVFGFPIAGLARVLVTDDVLIGAGLDSLDGVPLYIVHGSHDGVVAPRFGERLYARASAPKSLWRVEGRHIDAFASETNRRRLMQKLALVRKRSRQTQRPPRHD